MTRIVINRSYDKFCVSHQALIRLRELGQREALEEGDTGAYWPAASGHREPSLNQYGRLIPRDDEHLVQVVEELGEAANGHAATLRIVTILEDVPWLITETEGGEQVSEVHRTWGGTT
ncbi:MAG: hypothetical protein CV089_16465 [Nitrospira sp. WS110]|nr:hypothetical protein [Nitrospira sp. WS110]